MEKPIPPKTLLACYVGSSAYAVRYFETYNGGQTPEKPYVYSTNVGGSWFRLVECATFAEAAKKYEASITLMERWAGPRTTYIEGIGAGNERTPALATTFKDLTYLLNKVSGGAS